MFVKIAILPFHKIVDLFSTSESKQNIFEYIQTCYYCSYTKYLLHISEIK